MCKIVFIPNASKIEDMDKFSRAMAYVLHDQNDGFGYAALGENGVYGAKTLYPYAFSKFKQPKQNWLKVNTEYFGAPSPKYRSAMFHGRISTNKGGIINTHPMIRDNSYLIHNGVVDNLGEGYKKTTSNDSEDVLYHYLDGGIEKVSNNVMGYYACVVFKEDGTVTLFKDSIAPMLWAWSDSLNSAVYASTQQVLDKISNFIEEGLEGVPLLDNVHIVFDKDGNEVELSRFTPIDRMSANARKNSKKSIGKVVPGQHLLPIHPSSYVTPTDNSEEYYDIREGDDKHLVEIISPEYITMLTVFNDEYVAIYEDKILTTEEFKNLKLGEKISAVVKDPDGNVVDPFDWSHIAMDDQMNGTK